VETACYGLLAEVRRYQEKGVKQDGRQNLARYNSLMYKGFDAASETGIFNQVMHVGRFIEYT